jgi:hypothetical protein
MTNDIEVDIVSSTAYPVETILCSWFNSRDVGANWTTENIWSRLFGSNGTAEDRQIFHRLMKEKATSSQSENVANLFIDVISMDGVPINEFINFVITFNNVPRAFVDQLDRTRQAAFWEQSVRKPPG